MLTRHIDLNSPNARSFARTALAVPAASAILGASLLAVGGISPAVAESCPTGSTLISAGVCEVVFTATPSSNWTPPAGTTKLQALLVGGGGAGGMVSPDGYGGGGADVKLVDLAATGDVTIVVGVGHTAVLSVSNDSSVTQAGATTTALAGGNTTVSGGGDSPNFPSDGYGGAGAGASNIGDDGGPGLVVADLPGAAQSLFAGDTTCYGGGGASDGGNTTCGGGSIQRIDNPGDPIVQVVPRANSGGGGGGTYDPDFPGGLSAYVQDGADGIVILRYSGATLPDTGAGDLSAMAWTAAGALALGAGAVALAARPGMRRQGRHAK